MNEAKGVKMGKKDAVVERGECVVLNGCLLRPDEYEFDRSTGVITLKVPATTGAVLSVDAVVKNHRRRDEAQWKRERRGGFA